jgi:DNA invertase Pin-like site-specific DNA recombinase
VGNVGIYLRISDDRDGNQTATERQRADCTRHAESRSWNVVDVFEDVDLSAYKRNVKRPEFERMLQGVRDKRIDGVLAWKIDRITRRQRDLVRLDEACEEAGGFIATVVEGIDTCQPTGRFVAELLVAQARMESENQSVRLRRKAEELAKEGRPYTGGTRMFGYSRDRMAVIPEEAALIREAVRRISAGEPLRGLCWDWRKRGVTTPAGGPWQQHPLKSMLTSAALSGQREHRGLLTPGHWPAIIAPDDTRRLRAILNAPERLKVLNARRYLLTGFLRCGLCGNALVARPRFDGVRRYVCARQPGNDNCGKIARLAEPIEDLVRDAICMALDGVDLREHIERTSDRTGDLIDVIRLDEDTLQELSRDYYVDKRVSRAEYFAARDPIEARLEGNRHLLAQSNGHGLLNDIVGADELVRTQWDEKGLDWRRAVVGTLIDQIVIEPAVKGDTRFHPELVKITWKF